MRYNGHGTDYAIDLADKNDLRKKITDADWCFSHDELKRIIRNEFFNDENPLDSGIVDVAAARLLLLDGIELNAFTLQRERERLIHGILQEIIHGDK